MPQSHPGTPRTHLRHHPILPDIPSDIGRLALMPHPAPFDARAPLIRQRLMSGLSVTYCHDGHAHHDDRGHVSHLSCDLPRQLGLENLDEAEWKLDDRSSLEKQREL